MAMLRENEFFDAPTLMMIY